MIDITSISAMVAALGVLVGVVFTVLELRNLVQTRQIDLMIRLYSQVMSKDWLEAWGKVQEREILSHSEYLKKYGFVEVSEVIMFFEQLGLLLQKRLIDIDLLPIPPGQIKVTWEKVKPIAEGGRKRFNEPRLLQGFEYLANEMQKREQQIAKIQ